jgi:hypothetical protein
MTKERLTARLVVVLEPGEKRKLLALAARNDRTLSGEVRRLVRSAVSNIGGELAGGQQESVSYGNSGEG